MSDVKWIRLAVDIFDNRKIKHIRRMDMGERKFLIWIYLLTLAGKCNAGGDIFLTPDIPYTVNELAKEIDVYEHDIEESLTLFEQLGMISVNGGFISVLNWEEYQNAQGLERIREQTRNRVAKYRQERGVTECNVTSNVTSNATVTHCNATEEEIRIRNKNKNTIKKEGKKESPSGYEAIIENLSDSLKDAVREFLKMRKLIRKPMTDRALTILLNKLRTLATDEKTQIAILEQSITGGWASVYPLKENGYTGGFKSQKGNPALNYQHSPGLLESVKKMEDELRTEWGS